MRASDRFQSDELSLVLHDSGVRTGACSGLGLAVTFSAWLYIANRVPALDHLALERNVVAAAVLAFFFLIPVVRFMWQPGRLLVSSLIAWSMLTFAYGGLTMHFGGIAERYSTMQVFILG